MSIKNKERIKIRKYYSFLFSCAASFLGLATYVLLSKRINFPINWLTEGKKFPTFSRIKLFFTGISVHLQVNFILSIFLSLFNLEKVDYKKIRKWKFWASKFIVFLYSTIVGLLSFWPLLFDEKIGGISWSKASTLCLLITVINCCFIDALVQLMNEYGVCDATSLIMFFEFIPFGWIKDNFFNSNFFVMMTLSTLFVWLTSLTWEREIETNSLYNQSESEMKKRHSKLGLRMNFNFMPMIYLLSFVLYILRITREGLSWETIFSLNKKKSVLASSVSGNFWDSFFALNQEKFLFNLEFLRSMVLTNKNMILSFLLLLSLRLISIIVQARNLSWKTKEISEDLRNKGVYIDGIAPGRETKKTLDNVINKMSLLWFTIVILFNTFFDNYFFDFGNKNILTFFNWFGSVIIGIDLIRQKITRYKYISNK